MLKEYIEQLNKLPQKIFVNSVQLDSKKLTIGIVCAQNDLSLAHKDLLVLCEKAKEGIVECGANCKLMFVSAIDDTLLRDTKSAKYSLPSRDIVANQVEMLCATECFDGLLFVASQPNVVCGMLLGAIRVNLPCAFVSQGTMSPIVFDGKEYGYLHYAEQIALLKTGKTPYENLGQIENNLPNCFGTDCDSYSDNSFNCLLEVTGLAVVGNSTAVASTITRQQIARKTGQLAVELAQKKCTPRRLLSQNMFYNLIKVDLACGGSTTTLMNLIALAKELNIKNITLKQIGDIAKTVPLLLHKAMDSQCLMHQFEQAGGILALLKQLVVAKMVGSNVENSLGVTMESLVADIQVLNDQVIRATDNPSLPVCPLQVIYGNIAEEGAFVRSRTKSFNGIAKVYANEEMAIEAIMHREITKGDVVVIRNEGPQSCPGMREILFPFALLRGYGLSNDVAVITDGRISDGYDGFAVGHITPETNCQTVFSVLQDGDEIEINVTKGKINCDVKSRDIAIRLRNNDSQIGNYANPYLKNWAKNCDTATNGCAQITKK